VPRDSYEDPDYQFMRRARYPRSLTVDSVSRDGKVIAPPVLPGQVWMYRSGALELVVARHGRTICFLGSGRMLYDNILVQEAALVNGPYAPWAPDGFEVEP
jgi:hypothetical protein